MLDQLEPATATPRSVHLPGDVNMWVFVLGDLLIFAGYFVVFMVYRIEHHALFLASQRQLSLATGAVNTLVLLASSQFVAQGVRAAREDDQARAVRLMAYGGLCGTAFVLIKVFEWHHEISRGLTLPHNEFFMFYYALTGIHLLHVLLGLGLLALVARELRTPRLRRLWVVEAGATFWHMVDLLWVVIFVLLYVMR